MSDETANLTTLNCPSCGQTISVSTSAGTNAFSCPLCGEGFELESAPSDRPGGQQAAGTNSPAPLHQRTQKWSSGAVALVTLVIVMAAVGIGGYFASQTPVGKPTTQEEQNDWPIATQSGHTLDGVTVRVQSVQVGPVRAKNADGTAFVSDRQDYWTVRLRIRNGKETSIEYQTWHAADFGGEAATMKDDNGNSFVMQQFEDVALLQGQTLKKTLAPRESTLDVIVFEAPEGLDRDKLRELRLELPGAACQVNGVFRQVIPKSLVE